MIMAPPLFILVAALLFTSKFSEAALRTYNFTLHSGMKAPDGVTREVYLINGQQPAPLIEVDEGDELEVFVKNELSVDTTIHWHGLLQRGTPQMDGVPGVTQYPVAPGGNFTYKFSVGNEYGFYWYHSHFRAYYNDAIRGPLMIHPSRTRTRPFEKLAANDGDLARLLQAERDATPVLLHDWTHALSDTIYAQYFRTGAFPNCVDSLLANGLGRVECLPDYILQAGAGLGLDSASLGGSGLSQMSTGSSQMSMAGMDKRMDMSEPSTSADTAMSTMAAMSSTALMSSMTPTSSMTPMSSMSSMSSTAPMASMQAMTTLNARGCTPPMMFNPGFNLSFLPPEKCTNTTSTLLTISANSTQGWLALNLVNSGSVSKLGASLDAHSMYIYAADGLYVTLQEVKVLYLSIGQRYSVMIKLNQSPGDYYLRFASYPTGDMQQVVEGQAVVSYKANSKRSKRAMEANDDTGSVWMLKNGSATMNASTLDTTLLQPFEINSPPAGMAAITKFLSISQTGILTWVMDHNAYTEPSTPILYGNSSDGWKANTTLHLPFNSTIDLIMAVANDSMDTMGHPMHLHGHKFWVLGSGSGQFPYSSIAAAPSSAINLHDPPYRDTTDLPASGWVAIRYISNNPGAWLIHCHVQWHLVSGMALVLVEGEEQLPSILHAANISTTSKGPQSSTPAKSNAARRLTRYVSYHAPVVCIAAVLASLL